jgi:hypothetical protein
MSLTQSAGCAVGFGEEMKATPPGFGRELAQRVRRHPYSDKTSCFRIICFFYATDHLTRAFV